MPIGPLGARRLTHDDGRGIFGKSEIRNAEPLAIRRMNLNFTSTVKGATISLNLPCGIIKKIMEKSILLSVPNLKGRELEYVSQAISTEWVSTAGPFVAKLEETVAAYCKVPGAVSCQSGTAGLHIAMMLCGVRPGDAVIVPTVTFIAAVNPVKYIGAEPIFMDCDDTLCMDPSKLEEFCTEECTYDGKDLIEKKSGRRIACIVPVHVFGNMADMDQIMRTAERYGIPVVEDATEAVGTYAQAGRYAGRFAGTIGTMGVYSYNGNKIITTGGGGMIVSNHEELLKRAKHLTTQAKSDEANFIHDEIGYNYRLTNLQAALGLAQYEQLDEFIKIKERNYICYQQAIEQIRGLRLLPFRDDIRTNHWFYSLYCEEEYPLDRDGVIAMLREHRIQTRPIWGLIHEQKPYVGCESYKIEKAVKYRRHVVNLPCSTNLTVADVDTVVECLRMR